MVGADESVAFRFNMSQIESVRKQDTEENIWTMEGWSDRRVEKIILSSGARITHEGDDKYAQKFDRKV
jgi:hypothetical protein